MVPAFENAFAAEHGVAHAVAVSSATAGLHIACLALGIGPGSVVWTSPNSFVASANCALYCGAEIDFVDIDLSTRNLSTSALAEKLVAAERDGKLPSVVIPVHFSGMPCDLLEIRALADRYGFKVLEDASHAVGASYQSAPIGSRYAHASVFSFHPVKIITTGEGGLVTTQDADVAAKLRALRSHGVTRDPGAMERVPEGPWYYEQTSLGFNYRMTDLQAALGLAQLGRLQSLYELRRARSDRYDSVLSDLPLMLPARYADRVSALHLYVVEIDDIRSQRRRLDVFNSIRAEGVGANVHYMPIHLQPFYQKRGFKHGDFPAAERYYSRALSIPLHPRLGETEQGLVVAALRRALAG